MANERHGLRRSNTDERGLRGNGVAMSDARIRGLIGQALTTPPHAYEVVGMRLIVRGGVAGPRFDKASFKHQMRQTKSKLQDLLRQVSTLTRKPKGEVSDYDLLVVPLLQFRQQLELHERFYIDYLDKAADARPPGRRRGDFRLARIVGVFVSERGLSALAASQEVARRSIGWLREGHDISETRLRSVLSLNSIARLPRSDRDWRAEQKRLAARLRTSYRELKKIQLEN